MNSKTVLMLITLLCTRLLAAQELSLAQVWQAAETHDYEWQAAQAEHQASGTKKQQALALWLPTVIASGTVGKSSVSSQTSGAQFSAPAFGTQSEVDFNTSVHRGDLTRWQVSVQQPLFDTEKIMAAKQLSLAADIGELSWQQAQDDLRLQLTREYLDLVLAQEKVRLLERQLAAVRLATNEARERFQIGEASVIDEREAQATLSRITAELEAAKWALSAQQRLLADKTGQNEVRARFDGKALTAAARTAAQSDAAALRTTNKHIAMQRKALAVSAADLHKNNALISGISINLVGQIGSERVHGNGNFGAAENRARQGMVGIQAQIPLFTGGMSLAKQREARHLMEKSGAKLAQTEQNVQRQWQNLHSGLNADTARIEALHQAVSAAELRLDATKTGYQVGERTSLDVLNAENDRTAVSLQLIQAQADLIMHRLQQASLLNQLTPALLKDLGLGK